MMLPFCLRRPVALLAPLIAVVALAVGTPTAGADVCSGDSIMISTANQMVEFSRCANYTGVGTVTLANDIDLATETSPQDFRPIGTLSWPFRGTFDGNGKTISGLNLATPGSDNVGLFGYAGSATEDAVIRNLTLAAPQVTGNAYVGSLFGVLQSGRVENVRVTNAQVAALQWAGGLGGWLHPFRSVVVRNASVQGTATASMSYAGGLLGQVYFQDAGQAATIERVSVVGSAAANGRVGGAIGLVAFDASNSSLTIEDAAVRVGLTRNSGSPSVYFGGAIGSVADPVTSFTGNAVSLTRVYAAGAVPDHGRGGIVGSIDTTATIGGTTGTVAWDTQATGAAVAATGVDAAEVAAISVGRSTAQMKALATFTATPAWPIVSPWQAAATDRIWGLCASINSGYPFLLSEYAITPCAAPQAPTLTSATETGRTSVAAGFTAGAAGDAPINGYDYSLDNGSTWEPANPATTTSPLIVSGLTPGTVYQLRVRAVSDVGTGTLSAEALSVTAAACEGTNGRVLEEAGTADDPYLIASALDLAAIGTGTCALDAHHRQTADISLPSVTSTPGALEENFTPIGSAADLFIGVYDGGGHRIDGLVYDDRRATLADDVGMFAVVGAGAEISAVHLRDVRLRAGGDVGGLVGQVDAGDGSVLVEDVTVTGQVSGEGKVGGLIGWAQSSGATGSLTLRRAEADVDVALAGNSASNAGGAIGLLNPQEQGNAMMRDVTALGDVTATGTTSFAVGGLIGGIQVRHLGGTASTADVEIADVVARGAISVPHGGRAGGLVGALETAAPSRALVIDGAVASGSVSSIGTSGGLIGRAMLNGATTAFTLTNAYASGNVLEVNGTGSPSFGGLIGELATTSPASTFRTDFTYARGAVPGLGKGIVGVWGAPTLVLPSIAPTAYWDAETTGSGTSGIGITYDGGKSTAQMTSIGTYEVPNTPWPIVPLWQAPAAGRAWGICRSVNGGYPFLLMEYDAMPCAAPGAPTALVATAGDGTVQIAFTAGAAGDAAITEYQASVDGGAWTTVAGTASPLVVTGLVNGRRHAIRLRALNAVGVGAASAAVDGTPAARAATTVRIAKTTVLPGGRVQARIQVSGPGRIAVTGTRANGGRAKAKSLCAATKTAKKAGTYTLVCTLDRKSRAALKRAPLRLALRVAFTPTGGTTTATTETITLPRAKR
jgi:hypothetical protein